MGRPRLPTEVQEIKGAFKHDPKRRRAVGPKSTRGIGDPPGYFEPDEQLMWLEIVDDAPANVLTSADRTVIELLTRLRARFRRQWLTGAEMASMTWCLSHLGFTPSDRSRVEAVVGGGTAPDAADEFLN